MVKVSITLPNSALITLESEEPEIIREVVDIVLRDLPNVLMRPVPEVGQDTGEGPASQKGSSVDNYQSTLGSGASAGTRGRAPANKQETNTIPPAGPVSQPSTQQSVAGDETPTSRGAPSGGSTDAFVKFCGSASPLGDMRRVVVAAEGANRFLGMESVNAEELGRLFDLAGWRYPHNFTQTLRNAARDKFRWLERLPGRSGRYAATDLGLSVTLGE